MKRSGHNVMVNLGAHNAAVSEREENDYYATDPRAAEMLLERESFSPCIWEPACGEGHIARENWAPGETGTESLWEEICETHDGTKYDPIPYNSNMALQNGLYYTQGGVLYRCTRDTGNPVYHAMSELVGIYVEVA